MPGGKMVVKYYNHKLLQFFLVSIQSWQKVLKDASEYSPRWQRLPLWQSWSGKAERNWLLWLLAWAKGSSGTDTQVPNLASLTLGPEIHYLAKVLWDKERFSSLLHPALRCAWTKRLKCFLQVKQPTQSPNHSLNTSIFPQQRKTPTAVLYDGLF